MPYITHDDTAIYGCGDTEHASYADAIRDLTQAGIKIVEQTPDDSCGSWCLSANLRTVAATPALVERVRSIGGAIPWFQLDSGVQGTYDEYQAMQA